MKKTLKRSVSLLLALLMLLSVLTVFSSCNKPSDDSTSSDGLSISEYKITYSENASDDIKKVSNTLRDKIKSATEAELVAQDDWVPSDEKDIDSVKEIIVGEANRKAVQNAKSKLDTIDSKKAFIIDVSDNKIVILGKNDDVTMRAVKYFVNNFVNTSKSKGTIAIDPSYSEVLPANLDTVILTNLVELDISDEFTVYDSGDPIGSPTFEYPTLVELSHNGEANGTLFATLYSSEDFYRILKSTDSGENWTEVSRVSDTDNSPYYGGTMPFLYELPADIGELKEGTLILSGMSRDDKNHENSKNTVITLYYSTDLGATWDMLPNVATAGGYDKGIWEPFLIYEEETGRIYCFYSDDSDPAHDQKLVFKYSTDMKNWSDVHEAVACNDSKLRPGMISIAKMNNGEYYMTYEMVGLSMNPIYYKKTTDLSDWGDPSDYGKPIKAFDGTCFGSSPWCAWTPEGGECGTLIIAAKHWAHDKGQTKTAPDLFLSFDYGETYVKIDNPIDYIINDKNRCGYSPMLLVSSDGKTVYYMNNPDVKPSSWTEKITIVRIKVSE